MGCWERSRFYDEQVVSWLGGERASAAPAPSERLCLVKLAL